MRYLVCFVAVALTSMCAPLRAQLPPPSILKQDCTPLKGKAKKQCEARNTAGDTPVGKGNDSGADMPTGADADAPGEPPTSKPSGAAKNTTKTSTSDMPTGNDADPPADSMVPLLPNGSPDPRGPLPQPASSGSSSSSSSSSDDDVAPTTSGSDTPVKATALKDLGSHADTSAARVQLEQNRVADDLKVGRFYLHDGDLPGAEARFKDALQHDPDDPEAHFAMAELLLKQKRNAEAATELKRYLDLAPDDEHTKDARKMLAKLGR